MQVIAIGKAIGKRVAWPQLNCLKENYRMAVRIMKLTAIILLAGCLQLSARGVSQTITLTFNDAPLMKVFKEIERQTDYTFFYKWDRLENAKKVTISVKNLPLNQVLDLCFKDQPFTYSISGKTITIETKMDKIDKENKTSEIRNPLIDVRGRVVNSKGEPVSNATITVQGTTKATTTDADGNFVLTGIDEDAVIVITHVQYEPESITINGHSVVNATLQIKINSLDELQVIAYGTTTKRFNTGNVASVKSSDIEKQPVNNPLLALEGRVPGLEITQQTGIPGGAVKVRIEGQNSLSFGSDPLYVIDGVPYTQQMLGNVTDALYTSSGISPLSFINPSDIESIEILKDADATSIYGSRAAAGAILITTKKGKAGHTSVDLNLQTGWGKVGKKLPLLNTRQYLEMRHEAKTNDGASISSGDYDINGTWDTTRYTDWQKELLGGTARYTNAQLNISGGNNNTTFSIGAGYHKETTVFPGNLSDQKGSLRFNINNTSSNQKFHIQLSGFYLSDNNRLITEDLTAYAMRLAPDAPALYNPDGSLNWAPLPSGTSTWYNPLALFNKRYSNKTNNLISNAVVSYEVLKGLKVQSSFGYTNLMSDETRLAPSLVYPPEYRPTITTSSTFANTTISSWIAEPQLTYQRTIAKGKFEALLGSTFLEQNNKNVQLQARGFSSDALLENIGAAASILNVGLTNTTYRYNAIFARFNYNCENKYILNLSGRRDGSSRFGSNNLFNNFGSIGGAWLFSNENFITKNARYISFGKLRASYGTTGNDQIGDYQFMNLYNPISVSTPYGGGTALTPNIIPNPYLEWESTKKLQFGLDLGFFNNRILLNANYYFNRSSNQLQFYSLPLFAGRNNVQINFPAVIQNTGWELALSIVNLRDRNFSWKSNINLTIPKNKLISYPGLENTTNANFLIVGQPITITKARQFVDVNSTTGLYEVLDENGIPTSSSVTTQAYVAIVNQSTKFYGGFENSFQYKNFEIDFLFQFAKKIGTNYFFGNQPGKFGNSTTSSSIVANQPVWVLDRWQKPGDDATHQKFSSTYPTAVNTPFNNGNGSDARYSDASFIRLKNVSISWRLPEQLIRKARLQNLRLFAQGQNLMTITNYKGLDPETLSVTNLPPLRVITTGIQIIF